MKIATILLLIVFTTICHCDEHEHTVSSYGKKSVFKVSQNSDDFILKYVYLHFSIQMAKKL